jgi:dipeptidyl aminopeptidase/acylaminoacyl peptidase
MIWSVSQGEAGPKEHSMERIISGLLQDFEAGAVNASATDPGACSWRDGGDRLLTWYDRDGKVLGTIGEPGDYRDLALSPDGTRVAYRKRSGQTSNIWLLDLSRGTNTRFTFGSTVDSSPLWSPDGKRIVFRSGNDLYQKLASGVKDPETLRQLNRYTEREISDATRLHRSRIRLFKNGGTVRPRTAQKIMRFLEQPGQ